MSKFRDLETMIEILDHTIARREAEEKFFRRSGPVSSNNVAHSLFSELADDSRRYIDHLEKRRLTLLDVRGTLKEAGKG